MYSDNKFTVLDGGLATELERNGFSLQNDPLWSASMLYKNPKAIKEVHKSFLSSGAEIITTASYQASITGFQKHLQLTMEESEQLLKRSVELAKRAKDEYLSETQTSRKILIAGSIGPYGAALADGSEYTGNYCDSLTHEDLISWHRSRVRCLVEAGVDLLALETLPALKEGEALMKVLTDTPNVKAWLSFSSQSMHKTSHNEDVGLAVHSCLQRAPQSRLVAVGVNCCSPEQASSLLKDIAARCTDVPLIAYPNSGEVWDTKTGWSGTKASENNKHLESWLDSGAKIVGGCCRTTPEDILQISLRGQQNQRNL